MKISIKGFTDKQKARMLATFLDELQIVVLRSSVTPENQRLAADGLSKAAPGSLEEGYARVQLSIYKGSFGTLPKMSEQKALILLESSGFNIKKHNGFDLDLDFNEDTIDTSPFIDRGPARDFPQALKNAFEAALQKQASIIEQSNTAASFQNEAAGSVAAAAGEAIPPTITLKGLTDDERLELVVKMFAAGSNSEVKFQKDNVGDTEFFNEGQYSFSIDGADLRVIMAGDNLNLNPYMQAHGKDAIGKLLALCKDTVFASRFAGVKSYVTPGEVEISNVDVGVLTRKLEQLGDDGTVVIDSSGATGPFDLMTDMMKARAASQHVGNLSSFTVASKATTAAQLKRPKPENSFETNLKKALYKGKNLFAPEERKQEPSKAQGQKSDHSPYVGPECLSLEGDTIYCNFAGAGHKHLVHSRPPLDGAKEGYFEYDCHKHTMDQVDPKGFAGLAFHLNCEHE